MPITTAEIKWFKSALTSDATPAQNGGRFTQTEIVSGVKNNILPDVSAAQRAAGVEHWRKVFIGVRNAANLPLVDPKISIEIGTPGDSYVLLHPGTQTDTQDTLTGRPYGYGVLAEAVEAAAINLVVTTEADYSALPVQPFQEGDLIRIDARANVAAVGDSEYARINTLTHDGDEMTLTLDATLTHGYAAGSRIASVIEPGDIAAGYSGLSTTGGATFDDTTHPPVVPSIGGIYQTWTVTVTNGATGALSVIGDTIGGVGTGATGVDLAPANPLGGVYFILPAAGWGGTPADGDTLVFTTVPAAVPIWYHRIVPAGAGPISSDPVSVCVEGESA